MPREAVEQATCEACDDNDAEFRVTDSNMVLEDDTNEFQYSVTCSCGLTGTITLDAIGTSATEDISYDDASWNTEDDDDE